MVDAMHTASIQALCAVISIAILCVTMAAADETLKLSASNVHWGYFSKRIEPILTINSGKVVEVEMATHHACHDWDRMIKGDAAMEDLFTWDENNVHGLPGGRDGAHILTGPIFVQDAEPGDILKVEILNLKPRVNPHNGRTYGSNAATSWGYHARANKVAGPALRAGSQQRTTEVDGKVITIYEIMDSGNGAGYAVPSYQFAWPNITDPDGIKADFSNFPGICVPHEAHGDTKPSNDVTNAGWRSSSISYHSDVYKAQIPLNYHVGCMGLAPASHEIVDSIPPMVTGGNLDNKRIGVGTTMYYPVEVNGGLLSMGDAHAAQGDSALDGTGIETSITGKFRISVIKKQDFSAAQKVQDFPLGETEKEWIVHGFTVTNYLETFATNPGDIYAESSIDNAMSNAYTQTRKFVMAEYGMTESEANSAISVSVDFGMTQLINGNWGVHAIIPKIVFSGLGDSICTPAPRFLGKSDVELSASNVHWGYFSKHLEPVIRINSGEHIIVDMATQHACDDWDNMIKGDRGLEDIYTWNSENKPEDVRGATGSGDGVHILTGPIYVRDAEPGDILKVEVLDLVPRPNADGKTFGSNAAAYWGFQSRVKKADGTVFMAGSFTKTPKSDDEGVTIYELVESDGQSYAVPSYQFQWPVISDPNGVTRNYIKYPGTCVPHQHHGAYVPSNDVRNAGWKTSGNITYVDNLYKTKIPVNLHIGCMGLAPSSHDIVDSIPPMVTGGNLDDKRVGVGATMYYPVQVEGGLLSLGDPHTAQGDAEINGSGIETSITGKFRVSVIKQERFTLAQKMLDFPLGETEKEWIIHGFTEADYLEKYADNPSAIYGSSSADSAMINAFIQTRKFVMAHYRLTEPEANTIVAQGVDFGMTQLANGNWGVHGIVPKSIFTDGIRRGPQEQVVKFADGSPNVGKARSLPVTSILVWCLVLGFLRFVKWRAKI